MASGREPVRTCVGCRTTGSKRSLLRVARLPDGRVVVDPSGRAPGRGAYVHRDLVCVEAALARGGLWRILRTGAPLDAAARLRREIEGAIRT
ncbi:MAG TPA: YlxR family protein [Actinomycetota bacterium]|nr:YlxR family protein [Actinomycetota bacterium]